MKFPQKYSFFLLIPIFFIAGCSKESDSKNIPNAPDNSSVKTENSLSSDAKTSPEQEIVKKPGLPSLPATSVEEAAKELGLDPKVLSNPTSTPVEPDLSASQKPAPVPDAQTQEAMDPKSTKDCESYEAKVLQDICYNARGLSKNSNAK